MILLDIRVIVIKQNLDASKYDLCPKTIVILFSLLGVRLWFLQTVKADLEAAYEFTKERDEKFGGEEFSKFLMILDDSDAKSTPLSRIQIILDTLQANNWNRNETADSLGINRTTLYKKMKRFGLLDG